MVAIDDLIGIPEDKRRQIITCLDSLLTCRDSQGRLSPVISGYNMYNRLAKPDSAIMFSNLHATEAYKCVMLSDLEQLGYNTSCIEEYIRKKTGVYLWELYFNVRDDKDVIFPGLQIKDVRTGRYVGLASFFQPLDQYNRFSNCGGFLLGEDLGWQLDMPFKSKDELVALTKLFLKKSGEYIYTEAGREIPETAEERTSRNFWPDAYEMPVLILGREALNYMKELPHFVPAIRIILKENNNEISFVIHEKLEKLRAMPQYKQLVVLGFNEELCLANKPFIDSYIDKKR